MARVRARVAWRGRSLHPVVAAAARGIVAELARRGLRAVVTSGYRSLAKQRQLYNRYLRGGPLAAKPGSSAHNFGLAVDIAFPGERRDSRHYATMHRIARTFGLEPLSARQRAVDPYHVEVRDWRDWVR